jgi:hypothetical protein
MGLLISRLLLLELPVPKTSKRSWIFDTCPPNSKALMLSGLDELSSLYFYED